MIRLPQSLAIAALCLAGHPSVAQEVSPCDWRARADAIVEPWDTYSRTFANGAVRVALLDTIEPAAGALHLLVLAPPYDELGGRGCSVVSLGGGLGFAGLAFTEIEAGYDPARGLVLTMPGSLYLPDEAFTNPLELTVTINQSTGEVTAETALGRD